MDSSPSVSDLVGKTRSENYIIIVHPNQAKKLPKAANLEYWDGTTLSKYSDVCLAT